MMSKSERLRMLRMREPKHRDREGWQLTGVWLEYPEPRHGFDLSQLTTSAKMLNLIMEVSAMRWVTPEILVGLVCVLDDVLAPTHGLCRDGLDRPSTPAAIKQIVEARHEAMKQAEREIASALAAETDES
jgi:hypothetical protein